MPVVESASLLDIMTLVQLCIGGEVAFFALKQRSRPRSDGRNLDLATLRKFLKRSMVLYAFGWTSLYIALSPPSETMEKGALYGAATMAFCVFVYLWTGSFTKVS
jgi:hypothetical protein